MEVAVVSFFGFVIKHLFTSWCLLQRQAFGDLQLEKGQKKATNDIAISLKSNDSNSPTSPWSFTYDSALTECDCTG